MAQSNQNPSSFLNQRISLISKANIRYEGFLYAVDPRQQTVSLAEVSCHGTEDRDMAQPVPPSADVYQYIIFPALDIKEIIPSQPKNQVIMGPKQSQFPQSYGYQPQNMMPNMPFGYNNYSYPSWGANSYFNPTQNASVTPEKKGQAGGDLSFPAGLGFDGLGGLSSGISGMGVQGVSGLGNFDQLGGNKKPQDIDGVPSEHFTSLEPETDKRSQPFRNNTSQQKGGQPQRTNNTKPGQPQQQRTPYPTRDTNQPWKKTPESAPAASPAKFEATPQPKPDSSAPQQQDAQVPASRPKDNTSFFRGRGSHIPDRRPAVQKPASPTPQSQQQGAAPPARSNNAPRGGGATRGRGRGTRGRGGGRGLDGEVPIGDFDLEASTATFDKSKFYEELENGPSQPVAPAKPAESSPAEPTNDQFTDDFFDTMSRERDESREGRRREMAKNKKTDDETFGAARRNNNNRNPGPRPAAGDNVSSGRDNASSGRADNSKPRREGGNNSKPRGGYGAGRGGGRTRPNYREKEKGAEAPTETPSPSAPVPSGDNTTPQ